MTTLHFNHIRFLKSVAKIDQLPPDTGREVAFAGRSNAGKSTALNAITGVHGLARVSKTPGRTQLINFFVMNDFRIADLPGYGYAKVPEATKIQWQKLLDAYVQQRESLQGLVLLMDIRQPLKPFDLMMIDWAVSFEMPLHILLSKSDKLNRGPAQNVLKTVQNALSIHEDLVTVQLFSALKGSGIIDAREKISAWLTAPLIEENI